ncbi:MAG: sugar ABC transporter permease [Ruminococcaceae bacterium]|nr:sugar ABC transporter permease [Oscillospiraceae bacterium]
MKANKSTSVKKADKTSFGVRLKKDVCKNADLYVLVMPVILFYVIFHYAPILGAIIAFKDYTPNLGIFGSPWVGFKHFIEFFQSASFFTVFRNTIVISFSSIVFGFPAPIILALLFKELSNKYFSGFIKTVAYIPHFISVMVLCAMIKQFVSDTGLIGLFVNNITGGNTSLLNNPDYFTPVYVVSEIWQTMGWNSIVYMAAFSAIDTSLYEAAEIDGAGRWGKLIHVTIPGVITTIIIMLILKLGKVFSLGYEKIILLYNPMTYEKADIISSFVYRKGLQEFNYSFSTAVGLFNSIINFIFLISVNKISKKVSDISLW